MEHFLYLVTPFGFSLMITILLIPVWISVCKKWGLFDEPDNRKHHTLLVPSMGGIAIFAGLFCSFLIFSDIQEHDKIQYLSGATLILFFTGFFDDLINVKPFKKLIFQTISTLAVFLSGFRVTNLDGIAGIYEIPFYLQLPITLILVLVFVNAYNFIDGVDGLAGSLGVIISSCIGALFFHYNKPDFAIFSFCISGALLGFLFYNFSPAKIFMGDTGSLVIGFLLAVLSIELLNQGVQQPIIAVSPSFLYALLFIPLYDFTRVFIIRVLNGQSPFKPDRNHLHHKMLRFGFGHRSVSLLMASISLMIIGIHQIFPFISVNSFILLVPVVVISIFNDPVLKFISSIHHRVFGNHAEASQNQ